MKHPLNDNHKTLDSSFDSLTKNTFLRVVVLMAHFRRPVLAKVAVFRGNRFGGAASTFEIGASLAGKPPSRFIGFARKWKVRAIS